MNCYAATSVNTPRFFHGAIYGIWGAITTSLVAPALAYLLAPLKGRKEESWIDVGDVTRLAPNEPVELVFRRSRVDGWKSVSEKVTAWVVKTPAGVTAFGPQCTHLGCAYHWDERGNRFVCPCHTSFFSIEGKVITGPAPRPLDRYQVRVEGNKLLIGEIAKAPGNQA